MLSLLPVRVARPQDIFLCGGGYGVVVEAMNMLVYMFFSFGDHNLLAREKKKQKKAGGGAAGGGVVDEPLEHSLHNSFQSAIYLYFFP